MNEPGNKSLRELARAYYEGDLSYELYRSERAQLLDSITHQPAEHESGSLDTQAMQVDTRKAGPYDRKQVPGFRRQLWLWLLAVALIAMVVLLGVMLS